MLDQNLKQQVRQIIAKILELSPEELTDDANFIEEYGADSMSGIEMLAWLEGDLGLNINEEHLDRFTNVTEVFAVIEQIQQPGYVS